MCVAFVAVLVVCATAPTPVTAQTGPHARGLAATPAQTAGTNETTPDMAADSVLLRLDVAANGSAVWQVEYRFQLTESGDREAFDAFQQNVSANRSQYTDAFAARIRPVVTAAENQTGRGMSLSNVSIATREQQLAQPTGIVTYTFTWDGFAAVDGTSIRVGDAIRGFYLSPETKLTVVWPDGYRLDSAVPAADTARTHRLTWQGELGFGTDEPKLVFVPADAPGTTDAGVPWLLVGVAGLVVLGGLGAIMVWRRDDGGIDTPNETETATGSAAPAAEGSDQPLLTDEERALAAIEQAGGRLKQQELVAACDWGESKTSRVVSDLKEDGEIEVLRLGRENVLSLPTEDDHDE